MKLLRFFSVQIRQNNDIILYGMINKKWTVQRVSFLSFIIWGIMILFFSSQSGETSASLSLGLARRFYQMIENVSWVDRWIAFDFFHFMLRKLAHLFVYTVFGFLSFQALVKNTLFIPLKLKHLILFGLIYAVLDETLQYFTPGRVFALTDIVIDFVGFCLGVYGVSFLKRYFSRHKIDYEPTVLYEDIK